jgi:hypothetical protein
VRSLKPGRVAPAILFSLSSQLWLSGYIRRGEIETSCANASDDSSNCGREAKQLTALPAFRKRRRLSFFCLICFSDYRHQSLVQSFRPHSPRPIVGQPSSRKRLRDKLITCRTDRLVCSAEYCQASFIGLYCAQLFPPHPKVLMKKVSKIVCFVATSALSISTLCGQETRPRRVGTASGTRTERPIERPIERPRNRSWTRILGTMISIGAEGGGCTPSRDTIRRRPRL